MDFLLYVVATLFVILAAACVVLVVLQLPGTWIMLGLAVIIELIDGLYLTTTERTTFGWGLLIAVAALFALGEIFELIASALGAGRAGASRRGMLGAMIGGVAGALALAAPLAFIGPFGLLVGALIGTFVGALVGEVTAAEPRSVRDSLRPATGATIGRVLATVGKVGIAMAGWLVLSVAAFLP